MASEPQFEIRIIRVRWASKDVCLDLETAHAPIPLIDVGERKYRAEVTAYPEVSPQRQGQVAVSAPDLVSPPELVLADGNRCELSPVKDGDGRTWWIEKGKWKKAEDGGYYDAPLCRHAGEAHLWLGQVAVRLWIAAPGFTETEFETLLDEFRNGLWQLILDPRSPATATDCRPEGGLSEEFLEAVRNHIRHANRALDQPHRELRERQEQQLLARVRPTTKTFQELAFRGSPRHVTGRGHAPTFNTLENRQLLAMTSRLFRSLQALYKAAQGAADDFKKRADDAKGRADYLKLIEGRTKVDPEQLQREIAEQQERLSNIRVAKSRIINVQPPEFTDIRNTFEIKVTSDVEQERDGGVGFWAVLLSVEGKPRSKPEKIRFIFNQERATLVLVLVKNETYAVQATLKQLADAVRYSDGMRWKKRQIVKLFQLTSSLELKIANIIAFLKREQAALKNNDFWRKLNKKEKAEQYRDWEAEMLQQLRFHEGQIRWNKKSKELEPLIMQAAQLIDRAKVLGISQSLRLTFSGSMTYVQNPNYRGTLAAYRRAMDAANLDTTKLDQLFRLDEVGILDLPMVYERWCLLKIIRVLREQFKLIPEPNFRDNLLERLASEWRSKATLAIRFEGLQIQRDVLLEYQPKFRLQGQPDRIPDFALTVKSTVNSKSLHDVKYYPKMVLDAKCKRFAPIFSVEDGATLSDELQELIAKRGYDEGARNRVFVIHPGWNTESTKDWKRFCHYGGSHFTAVPQTRPKWDQGNPGHRHGAVLLRPGATDHLARLITMHLYLSLDDTLGAYASEDRLPRFPRVCPACGGFEMSESPLSEVRRSQHGNSNAVWCKDCQQMIVWNFSGGCGTRLWKLGGYWTFHDTDPLNPYNIKCPHCGDYMVTDSDAVQQDM